MNAESSQSKLRQAALQRVAATRFQSLPEEVKAERIKAIENVSQKPLNPVITHQHLVNNTAFLKKGWPALFPGTQELHLEIGCGYGHFLEWLAPKRPHTGFVGLDIVSKVLRRAQQRLGHIDNVLIGKLDALYTLRELVAPGTLDALYILFPDPWFKEKHQKRRTLREGTLALFASRIRLGGQLIFVSDDPPYAADALALLEACPYFEKDVFPEITVKTKYESKWLAQKKEIHRYAYRRVEHSDFSDDILEWQDASDPLTAQFDATHLAERMEALQAQVFPLTHHPKAHSEDTVFTLKLQRVYTGQSSGSYLFQGVVAEPHTLAQTVWFTLNADGKLQVPDFAPFPYVQRRDLIFSHWKQWIGEWLA